MSQLCYVCNSIDFAGILTPRERDPHTKEWKAIYKPELSENGKGSSLGRPTTGSTIATCRSRGVAPHIQAADYDSLSESTQSCDEEHGDQWELDRGIERVRISSEDNGHLAAEMSDDENSYDTNEDHEPFYQREEDDESFQAREHTFRTRASDSESSGREQVSMPDRSSKAGPRPSILQPLSDAGSTKNGAREPGDQGRSPHGEGLVSNSPADSDAHDGDRVEFEQYSRDSGASSFTWSGDSRFDHRHKINIQKQGQGNWTYQHGQFYTLGSIWDVRSRRHDCKLCSKLWQQMRRDWHVKNTFLRKSRCLIKLLEWKVKANADEPETEVVVLNMLFIYGYAIGQGWNMGLSFVFHGAHVESSDLRRTGTSSGNSVWPDGLFGQSRTIGTTCDFGLLRKWLTHCEHIHHHDEPDAVGDFTVRFINVHERRLVQWEGPTNEAPRFVALSYVWGKAPQPLLLTTKNISDMMEAGAFDSKILPKTINDAIDLVARIGEEYLWVDALCILQDSLEDKSVQIPQMYSIYSKATLTIVAASGEDADAGLPGVGPVTRDPDDFALDIGGFRVTVCADTELWQTPYNIGFKENYLGRCRYISRAWTMQEAFLSKRMLVFTQDQVYWECATGTWCEGTHWESNALNFVGQRAVKESTPVDVWEDNFDRQAYDIITDAEVVTYEVKPDSYECLVRKYTERELSYDGDILNAFTGILSFIASREQTLFLFGLRERHFGNDLLFNIMMAVPRRFSVQETRMPSWSWLAWKGVIEFANEVRNSSSDLVNDLVPCDGVKCYVLDVDDRGQKYLRCINETGGWRFDPNYVRRGEGIYDPTTYHITKPRSDADDIFDLVQTAQGRDKVSEWMTNLDSEAEEDQKQTRDPSGFEAEASTVSARNESQAASNDEPRKTSSARVPHRALSEPEKEIPVYSQTLTLPDIESHKSFPFMQPNLHIVFCTFSSSVELVTEEDEAMKFFSRIVTAGTKRLRRNGTNSNKDVIQRNLYISTEDQEEGTPGPKGRPRRAEDRILATLKLRKAQRTRGPHFGRLPPFSKAWNPHEYSNTVPDGRYTVLWMNNNQLPMFGHLLCRQARSGGAHGSGTGILERVCGVLGPTEILMKAAQEKWRAKWGCHVLG